MLLSGHGGKFYRHSYMLQKTIALIQDIYKLTNQDQHQQDQHHQQKITTSKHTGTKLYYAAFKAHPDTWISIPVNWEGISYVNYTRFDSVDFSINLSVFCSISWT